MTSPKEHPIRKGLTLYKFTATDGLDGVQITLFNNPYLAQNAGSPLLMAFPSTSFIMDPKTPYVEICAGVHNIFKLLHVEYVRRLNYLDLPTAQRDGVRFMVRMTF